MLKNADIKLNLSDYSPADAQKAEKALEWASSAVPQKKHAIRGGDVAAILQSLNADSETVISAILSDPPLKDHITYSQIELEFGSAIARLVKDTHWLNTLRIYSTDLISQPRQAETLRRMLLSMTHDVRSVLIKLAFRLQRLRILPHEDYDIRTFIARETLDIYAPIANRLGLGKLKWELEDMAFRYLQPQIYKRIVKSISDKRIEREQTISEFIAQFKEVLEAEKIQAKIYGRPKHIFSIWNKMQRKQLDVDQLYDLLAVRVIVGKVSECYTVLGLAHGRWQYVPKEFDDYIANPKSNGYQSLHTVVLFNQSQRIEIQIRTKEMDEFAEKGVAAHWRYKEGGKYNQATEKCINSLRQLLEKNQYEESVRLDDLKGNLYSDRVFVLTPAGKLIDLPKGSTPLDFAYSIHTEIGHRCQGAKVNDRIVQLSYVLQSGDKVEILTAKQPNPKKNWIDPNLGYLKSPRAITKVKTWFKHQQHENHLADGKQILEREIQKLELQKVDLDKLADHFKYEELDKFHAAIGSGLIKPQQIARALAPADIETIKIKKAVKKEPTKGIMIQGVNNVMTRFAKCCNPQPGDEIIGFMSLRSGITVHRKNCATLQQFNQTQRQRLLDADWSGEETTRSIPIAIKAYDRQGLLNDITRVLNREKINIEHAQFTSGKDLMASLHLTLQVSIDQEIEPVLSKIRKLPNIWQVSQSH
ncbi:MAG: RelA/SpoT family protein [Gammaproteobacteria bacterium]